MNYEPILGLLWEKPGVLLYGASLLGLVGGADPEVLVCFSTLINPFESAKPPSDEYERSQPLALRREAICS